MTRGLSLRSRLTLLVTGLSAAAILLFALSFYVLLQSTLLTAVDTRLRERAALAGALLARAERGLDQPGRWLTPEPLIEFEAPGIYVEVIGPDDRVEAASPNLALGALPKNPALLDRARSGQAALGEVTAGADEQLRLLIVPLGAGAPAGTVLLVAESLEPLQRTMLQTRNLLLAVGAVTLLVIVAGVMLLTEHALRPMERLTATTSRIASSGQYAERAPAAPHADEVGRLTAAVNTLIATVERTLGQQRQLLADTSHELRSPLTVVLANLDLLRRDLSREERDQSVREATLEAQRMRRLVNDLLLLAHSDAAQVIERALVRLDHLVYATVMTVARQHPSHHYTVEVADRLTVEGDAERLTQLIRNLLENAAYHTPPGTHVTVSLARDQERAILRVTDTGPGIPPADLAQLWERFYRVDKARSRQHGGSGLGLAIVKFLAEAHGGLISATSTLGRGSTFLVNLPLAPAEGAERRLLAPSARQ